MAAAKSNAEEFTVSDLSSALKRVVEDRFGYIRVRGEITGYRGPHSSGHAYFGLKDERARLDAVVWRKAFQQLAFKPEEGLEVIATGKLTTYPGSSKYQIVIDRIEPAGEGALMALLEARRKALAAEGLFDENRKKALPFLPKTVGVVTSPTGAVIRDICHRIADRFPLHVLVWPVRVQGETSGDEVARAIAGLDALPAGGDLPRPDVLIVARGGGSLEDLWGFNDEAVVRAVAACSIPVISAVGHETDWTLIDHVADRRAPTPTGAAEMAVPVRAELQAAVATFGARLGSAHRRLLDRRSQDLRSLARALPSVDALLAIPRRRHDEAAGRLARALVSGIALRRNRLTHLTERLSPTVLDRQLRSERQRLTVADKRLDPAIRRILERRRESLVSTARLIEVLSHQNVLARGYAVVRDSKRNVLTRAGDISAGMALHLEMDGGTVLATASEAAPGAKAERRRAGSAKTGTSTGGKTRKAAAKPTNERSPATPVSQKDLFD
ncbi:exodeoxyribonuclease VII large subunit [Notoacmeibacter marinus]|uniref:exodeoxyribonuclease VII large subunit n=1 Tax=Notoacmeibacter marinus TaxID=1876515 RepID=UPI001FE139AD|nr:exodeoxyribonuclease VII large subunit [Notoacmeibacter marinus]